jgi:hypothetical protein
MSSRPVSLLTIAVLVVAARITAASPAQAQRSGYGGGFYGYGRGFYGFGNGRRFYGGFFPGYYGFGRGF